MSRRALGAGLAATALALGGCAHAPPEAAFPPLRAAAVERGLPAPQWRLGEAADAAARGRVAELLAADLTPEAAVEIAVLNNPALQAAFEELGIAQAEVVQAGKLANPVLVGSPRFSDHAGTDLDLGLTQNLLQLLVRPARRQLAEAQLAETRLRVADEVLRLAAAAQGAYFEVVGAQQVREMRQLIVEATAASFALAERIHGAGNLSELQLAHERILYEEARVALGRSEVELGAARESLTRLLGLWGKDAGWTLAGRLPELPAEEPPLAALETLAIERRLDLAARLAAVEIAAAALGITRDWRWLLSAEIGVSAERETGGEWLVGPELSLELPVFDQGQARIAEAEARLRQRAAELAALAVEVRSEVRELRDRLLLTRDLAAHYREVVIPLRERIVRLTEEEYNFMLVGAFDLLLAKQSEYDAYQAYIEAVRDYWVTRAELQRAVGGNLGAGASPAAAPPPAAEPAHDHSHHPGMKR